MIGSSLLHLHSLSCLILALLFLALLSCFAACFARNKTLFLVSRSSYSPIETETRKWRWTRNETINRRWTHHESRSRVWVAFSFHSFTPVSQTRAFKVKFVFKSRSQSVLAQPYDIQRDIAHIVALEKLRRETLEIFAKWPWMPEGTSEKNLWNAKKYGFLRSFSSKSNFLNGFEISTWNYI